MSWGTQRRNTIILLFILGVLILIGTYIFSVLNVPPTCFDGKRNGEESGIDCGGSCELICNGDVVDLRVHWNRYFEVAPGIYNAIAYVENLNNNSGVDSADYIFTLYDAKNFPLETRKGSIQIRPKEIIPIVENSLNTGKLIPVRSTFEFVGDFSWNKREIRDRYIVISQEKYIEVGGLPRITANITNTSINSVENVKVVVIVYDENNNAITTSSTLVEKLQKDETKPIAFTWPTVFSKQMNRFEIIPLYK